MLIVFLVAVFVTFMFACDYVFDGEKVFHVQPTREVSTIRPFTTIQTLVMSK